MATAAQEARRDPFLAALTAALEEVVQRGVEVTPAGDGWLIRVASVDARDESAAPLGRSW